MGASQSRRAGGRRGVVSGAEVEAVIAQTTHTLVIDDFWPTLTNRLMRAHWAARQRLLRQDAQVVACSAFMQNVPKAVGKRRVRVLVKHRAGSPAPDADAVLKSLLD